MTRSTLKYIIFQPKFRRKYSSLLTVAELVRNSVRNKVSSLRDSTLLLTELLYISHDNLLENGGSRNPSSRYPSDLKFFLPSVWTTSRRFAKFQVSISILTWFKRHLNMATFAKSYFFCITALASFGTKLR